MTRLLAAFYRGETTLADERRLAALLSESDHVAAADRLTVGYGTAEPTDVAVGMARLSRAIDDWAAEENEALSAPSHRPLRLAAAAAAMVAVASTAFVAWRTLTGHPAVNALMAKSATPVEMPMTLTLADTAVVGTAVATDAPLTAQYNAAERHTTTANSRERTLEAAYQAERALQQIDDITRDGARHIDGALEQMRDLQLTRDDNQI